MNIPEFSPELVRYGFSLRVIPPDGQGTSQIIAFGEAGGKHEDQDLIPFHPKADAGSVLARALRRANIQRDSLTLSNVCWQRPPGNELAGTPYLTEARTYWKEANESLIRERQPKVLLALGNIPLQSFTEFGWDDATSISHMQGYALPRTIAGVPLIVLPLLHPSFILHGQQAFNQVLIWGLQRAQQLVARGLTPLPTRYITKPCMEDMLAFERGYDPSRHSLAYDIETPESGKLGEDEVEDKEEDISYNIIRASLCYDAAEGYAISFPWQEPFIEIAKRMLASTGRKLGWNSSGFDNPRLEYAGARINGRRYDLMQSWHFLQPTLPASLEFASALLGWSNEPWKFQNQSQPELYSCIDAHATAINGAQIERALRARGVYDLHERHVVDCYEVLCQMSRNGLPYDADEAARFKVKLEGLKKEREDELQRRVPDELKPVKQKTGYKKLPKDCSGLVRRKFKLKVSQLTGVEKDRLAQPSLALNNAPPSPSPLMSLSELDTQLDLLVEVERWAKLEPFLPTSSQQMMRLIKWAGQKVGTNRKTKRPTTDDETVRKLVARCLNSKSGKDREFAQTLKTCREVRQLSKTLGTYVAGWKPGRDGRIHALPGFWGKMYRVSWRRPNLAATPQDKQEDMISAGFRRCVRTSVDRVLLEFDWKGIEAVIVGYLANDPDYIRLARLGVHDYLCCHVLAAKGKILASDIPSLTLNDGELKGIFKEIKKKFPKDRDDSKHIVHGSNYLATPNLIATMYEMPLDETEKIQSIYFERVAAKVRAWQQSIMERAHKEVWLKNSFGYAMAFWEIYRWNSQRFERLSQLWTKAHGLGANGMRPVLNRNESDWVNKIKEFIGKGIDKEEAISKLSWDQGDDAKSAVSFLPRDTAAAMLKEVLLRLRPLAEEGIMCGCAHDAVLSNAPKREWERVAAQVYGEMVKPVPELGGLVVDVEGKMGQAWDGEEMEVIEPAQFLPAPAPADEKKEFWPNNYAASTPELR